MVSPANNLESMRHDGEKVVFYQRGAGGDHNELFHLRPGLGTDFDLQGLVISKGEGLHQVGRGPEKPL